MKLSQTSIIAGSLIVAFIVFIVVRGELPGYLGVFTGTPAPTTNKTVVNTPTGGSNSFDISVGSVPGGGKVISFPGGINNYYG